MAMQEIQISTVNQKPIHVDHSDELRDRRRKLRHEMLALSNALARVQNDLARVENELGAYPR